MYLDILFTRVTQRWSTTYEKLIGEIVRKGTWKILFLIAQIGNKSKWSISGRVDKLKIQIFPHGTGRILTQTSYFGCLEPEVNTTIIMDRLTKSTHFHPVKVTYLLDDYAKLYLNEIVKMHGSPLSIILYVECFPQWNWCESDAYCRHSSQYG